MGPSGRKGCIGITAILIVGGVALWVASSPVTAGNLRRADLRFLLGYDSEPEAMHYYQSKCNSTGCSSNTFWEESYNFKYDPQKFAHEVKLRLAGDPAWRVLRPNLQGFDLRATHVGADGKADVLLQTTAMGDSNVIEVIDVQHEVSPIGTWFRNLQWTAEWNRANGK